MWAYYGISHDADAFPLPVQHEYTSVRFALPTG